MKQLNNFDVNVPELGDLPNITQVSDAIEAVENALAGTVEFMDAVVSGTEIALTSPTRTVDRLRYYDGMALKFVSDVQINANYIATVTVDGLPAQPLTIPFLVTAGDTVTIVYDTGVFDGKYSAIPRSEEIFSTSVVTVATSSAVKAVYDTMDGKKIDIQTKEITDWNDAIINGTYNGYDILNAPDNEWYLGTVEVHSSGSGWVTQTVHAFTSDVESDTKAYRRDRNNYIWGAWIRLRSSETELRSIFYSKSDSPYDVGDYWITESTANPATKWIGTLWSKVEGRGLIGSSTTYALGTQSGVASISLSPAHIAPHAHSFYGVSNPTGTHAHASGSHRHTVDSHAHTQPTHRHPIGVVQRVGTTMHANTLDYLSGGESHFTLSRRTDPCDSAGGENTGSSAPYTNYVNPTSDSNGDHYHTVAGTTGSAGSGSAFNIMNPYRSVNIWRRTA